MASVFSLSGFLKHLLRLEVHLLSFRRSLLSSTSTDCPGRTPLDSAKISYFFHSCNRLFPLPAGIAVRTLQFGRIFAKFEDLGVVHVGDQVLRFFAELVDLLRQSQVLNE